MAEKSNNIFLSYSVEDAFEASLLQCALEALMADLSVKVWTYERDQNKDERDVRRSVIDCIRKSMAMIFLLSPSTLDGGAYQWIELGSADTLEMPAFILLHHLKHDDLAQRRKYASLLTRELIEARDWMLIEPELRKIIGGDND